MESLETLNRLLNRAQRALNAAATCASRSDLPNRKAAIDHLVNAVEQVSEVLDLVGTEAPDLVYHFDGKRPPTAFMTAIGELVKSADVHIARGDFDTAKKLLSNALEMEPPPFAYEVIEKKLKALESGIEQRK